MIIKKRHLSTYNFNTHHITSYRHITDWHNYWTKSDTDQVNKLTMAFGYYNLKIFDLLDTIFSYYVKRPTSDTTTRCSPWRDGPVWHGLPSNSIHIRGRWWPSSWTHSYMWWCMRTITWQVLPSIGPSCGGQKYITVVQSQVYKNY